LLRKIVKKLGN